MRPEDQLSLLLAGTERRRTDAANQIAGLIRMIDPQAFLGRLVRQQVHPVLAPRFLAAGGRERLGARELEALEEALGRARTRGTQFALATDVALDLLATNGVAAIPVKGTRLAERLYGDPGARISGDVDLLVHRASLDAAVAYLRAGGWSHERPSRVGPDGMPLLHRVVAHPGGLPSIELHWRLDWWDDGAFAESMMRRATDGGVPTLALEDELTTLLLFYARDGFMGLRLAVDIAAWWDRFGQDVKSHLLERAAGSFPALRLPLAAAATAANQVVGAPPAFEIPEVGHRRRAAFAVRLLNWDLSGDHEQLRANAALVDGALTTHGWRGYVARHFRLPPGYSPETPALPGGRLLGQIWAGMHPLKLAARFAIGIVRVTLRGRWSSVR